MRLAPRARRTLAGSGLAPLGRAVVGVPRVGVEIGAADRTKAGAVLPAEELCRQRVGEQVAGPALDVDEEVRGVALLLVLLLAGLGVAVTDEVEPAGRDAPRGRARDSAGTGLRSRTRCSP